MKQNVTALERAFELARSGRYASVQDIKRRLAEEGYYSDQVSGPILMDQPKNAIYARHMRR